MSKRLVNFFLALLSLQPGGMLFNDRNAGFSDYSTGASSTVGLYFDEIAIPYTVGKRA